MCIGGGDSEPNTIKVICAGSLVAPFEAIEQGFEQKYPGIDVLIEAHGSIQVIRQVTELGQTADVLAVADFSLIPMLMYGEDEQASWYIKFATNHLGIAYTEGSAYSDEINVGNWPSIISREDVLLGFSDPRFDASGYRTLMILQLAEAAYGDEDLLESVLGDSFSSKIKVEFEEDAIVIKVPEILESISDHIVLRGSSIQLLSLLEAGAIDYAFEYENVSRYYGLLFLELPSSIDLSSDVFAVEDKAVAVDIGFKRFASVTPYFIAQKTFYGVTIPNSSKNKDGAELFVDFLLSEEGKAILEGTYLNAMDQPITDNYDGLPTSLREYVGEG